MSRFLSALACACLGLFVASAHGRIWISSDQITYTEVLSGRIFNNNFSSQLVWDGSQILAVAERGERSPLVTSPDGNNWTLRFDSSTPPPNYSVSGVSAIAHASLLGRYVTTQVTAANGL